MLITIGIIGVVSAMTIPTLRGNANMSMFVTKYKKTLSMLSQAGLMSQNLYKFDYGTTIDGNCNDGVPGMIDDPKQYKTVCGLLNGTMKGVKYYRGMSNIKSTYWSDVTKQGVSDGSIYEWAHTMTLLDGTVVSHTQKFGVVCHLEEGQVLDSEWIKNHKNCVGWIDVNGTDPPNKEVSCSDGTAKALTPETPCEVKKDSAYLTDIFPVVFHDTDVTPASNASMYVFQNY